MIGRYKQSHQMDLRRAHDLGRQQMAAQVQQWLNAPNGPAQTLIRERNEAIARAEAAEARHTALLAKVEEYGRAHAARLAWSAKPDEERRMSERDKLNDDVHDSLVALRAEVI